jgi:hypothetical protein
MPTFRFEALASSGDEVIDLIDALDENHAREALAKRGLFVTRLMAATAEASRTQAAAGGTPRTSLTPELQQRHRREKRTLGFGFIAMGLLVLLFGAWLAWDAVAFLSVAQTTTGTCVGQAYNHSDNDYNIPIIEFRVGHQTHRMESRGILGMSFKSGYRKGHRVTVMFPDGHPEEARVGGTFGQLQFPIVFLGAGLGFVLSGFWLTNALRGHSTRSARARELES